MFRGALARAGVHRNATTPWLRHTYTTMTEELFYDSTFTSNDG